MRCLRPRGSGAMAPSEFATGLGFPTDVVEPADITSVLDRLPEPEPDGAAMFRPFVLRAAAAVPSKIQTHAKIGRMVAATGASLGLSLLHNVCKECRWKSLQDSVRRDNSPYRRRCAMRSALPRATTSCSESRERAPFSPERTTSCRLPERSPSPPTVATSHGTTCCDVHGPAGPLNGVERVRRHEHPGPTPHRRPCRHGSACDSVSGRC